MRAKRDLYVFGVTDFEPAVGGTTRQVGLQARALSTRGHEVAVVTRRLSVDWPAFEMLGGLPIHRLGAPGRSFGPEKAALARLAWWLLRRRSGVAAFTTLMWTDAVASAAAAGLLPRTVIIWGLRGEATEAVRPGTSLLRRLQGRVRRALLRRCTHVALTPRMASELRESGISEHARVVPVPVECAHFRPPEAEERREARSSLGLDQDAPVLVFVGHLQRRKALDRLIEAVRLLAPGHPGLRLLVVGGAPGNPDDYEPQLRAQVAAGRLDAAVSFAGIVSDPRAHLWAADVLVLPSFNEGMPNTILEAMACGLPVVAPASAAGDEILDDATGVVPPSNDPRHLTEALDALLRDSERRARLGARARQRALDFDVERVAAQYEQLYREVSRSS